LIAAASYCVFEGLGWQQIDHGALVSAPNWSIAEAFVNPDPRRLHETRHAALAGGVKENFPNQKTRRFSPARASETAGSFVNRVTLLLAECLARKWNGGGACRLTALFD
jgi:hypothetical protein